MSPTSYQAAPPRVIRSGDPTASDRSCQTLPDKGSAHSPVRAYQSPRPLLDCSFMNYFTLTLGLLIHWPWVALAASPTLPPEALELLKKFPENKLTLDRVVGLAMETSDTYRALLAQAQTSEAIRLGAAAQTETELSLDGNYLEDRREPANLFSPNRLSVGSVGLGLNSRFSTGTQLGFSLSHSRNQINIPNFASLNYAETRGTLNLSQSLLRNALGAGTRNSTAAAENQARASDQDLRDRKEDWFLSIAEIFYGAWLQQIQLLSAQATVERRERLRALVGLKQRRGTAEKPDAIQVQSSLELTKLELETAKQNLSDQWRLLLITLKLPSVLETIDPLQVPISLDSLPEELTNSCKGPEVPLQSAAIERSKALVQAAKHSLSSQEWNSRPDLDLVAAYGANGIDSASGTSLSDFAKLQFPYYSLGLQFRLPLGGYERRAKLITARIDNLKAEAQSGQTLDLHRAQWRNLCSTYARLQSAVAVLTKTSQAQMQRIKLEETRYTLGRSTLAQLIQAEDEAAQTEVLLKSQTAQLHLTAWKIRKLSGTLDTHLQKLSTKGE